MENLFEAFEAIVKTLASKTCKEKVRYGREATANRALVKMQEKGHEGLEVYRCTSCEGYHLGHPPKPMSIVISRNKIARV